MQINRHDLYEDDYMKPILQPKPSFSKVAILVIAVHAAVTVLADTQSDSAALSRSLSRITDTKQLKHEFENIGRACREHDFLKDMVFDVDLPIEARISLTRLLGNYGDDRNFAKKVLSLSDVPKAAELKIALIQGFMEPGAHIGMPTDSIGRIAKDATESVEVRSAVISLMIKNVQRSDERLKQRLDRGHLSAASLRDDDADYRKLLQDIATIPETPAVLREMIVRDLPASSDNLARMKEYLKHLQGNLMRAEEAAKAPNLSQIKRYQLLMSVWSIERDVYRAEMLLAMELVRAYASDPDGSLPSSIPQPSDVTFIKGPYRYFQIASIKELSPDILVLIASKAHFFADGKTVFIQRGSENFDEMSIAEFKTALASQKSVQLAPSMTEMQPVLYVLNGSSHVLGYPKHMIKKVIDKNNDKRRQMSVPLIADVEAIVEESFKDVQVLDANTKPGGFPASAVDR